MGDWSAMARPPVLTVKKLIAMPPALAAAIEDWRFANRIGSEAEAIRRLIQMGLEAAAKGQAPKGE